MIFLYIFLGLVVTLLIVSALMPKTYNVEKSGIIKKPADEVMGHVGNFNDYAA